MSWTQDDADFAAEIAAAAGKLLQEVRDSRDWDPKELGKAGDAAANELLCHAIGTERPDAMAALEALVAEQRPDLLLLSGDILLGNGASNVTLHRVGDGRLPAGWQLQIVESLRRLAALPLRRVYPGHGPIIDDPAATIAERIARVEARLDQIAGWLVARPMTAYEVSLALFESSMRSWASAACHCARSSAPGGGTRPCRRSWTSHASSGRSPQRFGTFRASSRIAS